MNLSASTHKRTLLSFPQAMEETGTPAVQAVCMVHSTTLLTTAAKYLSPPQRDCTLATTKGAIGTKDK